LEAWQLQFDYSIKKFAIVLDLRMETEDNPAVSKSRKSLNEKA
jgi:hypothetical protein